MFHKNTLNVLRTIYFVKIKNSYPEVIFKKGMSCYATINGFEYKIHILAKVEENMIVFKYYGKNTKMWFYNVKSSFSLTNDMMINISKQLHKNEEEQK